MPSSACDWSSDVCSSDRSEERTSELQSRSDLVCRLLLEKKKKNYNLNTAEQPHQPQTRSFPVSHLPLPTTTTPLLGERPPIHDSSENDIRPVHIRYALHQLH